MVERGVSNSAMDGPKPGRIRRGVDREVSNSVLLNPDMLLKHQQKNHVQQSLQEERGPSSRGNTMNDVSGWKPNGNSGIEYPFINQEHPNHWQLERQAHVRSMKVGLSCSRIVELQVGPFWTQLDQVDTVRREETEDERPDAVWEDSTTSRRGGDP